MSKLLVQTILQLDYNELTRNIGAELDAEGLTETEDAISLLDPEFTRLPAGGSIINLGHVRNYESFLNTKPILELWARECVTRRAMDGPKMKDPTEHFFKLVDAVACLFALGYFKDNPQVQPHTQFLVRR